MVGCESAGGMVCLGRRAGQGYLWGRAQRRDECRPASGLRPLELPAEAVGAVLRAFALVEAVGILSGLRAVQLQVRRPALPRPRLGGIEQGLADAVGAPLGVHREVLDPCAIAEADREEVLVGS